MNIADLDSNCPGGSAGDADFMIDLICIDWDSVPSSGWMDGLTGPADMMPGLRVEAEGHFNAAGILIAEKIKGRGNRVRISAIASNVDGTGGPGTLDVFGGAIQVTTESGLTDIEDPILNGGGFEIRGIRTGATSVLALRIKDDSVDADRQELRAEVDVDGADSVLVTITVMGISSRLDDSTQLEIEDSPFIGTPVEFLDSIDDDGIVDTTNGPNDVVEVRINTNSGDGSTVSPYAAKQVEIEREDD